MRYNIVYLFHINNTMHHWQKYKRDYSHNQLLLDMIDCIESEWYIHRTWSNRFDQICIDIVKHHSLMYNWNWSYIYNLQYRFDRYVVHDHNNRLRLHSISRLDNDKRHQYRQQLQCNYHRHNLKAKRMTLDHRQLFSYVQVSWFGWPNFSHCDVIWL